MIDISILCVFENGNALFTPNRRMAFVITTLKAFFVLLNIISFVFVLFDNILLMIFSYRQQFI